MDLALQSTPNAGFQTLHVGRKAIMLSTLKVDRGRTTLRHPCGIGFVCCLRAPQGACYHVQRPQQDGSSSSEMKLLHWAHLQQLCGGR